MSGVVVDTGVVVALLDADDTNHQAAAEWIATYDDDLVTTPMALAEMDHFAQREGARTQFWRDLERGVYTVRWWADGIEDALAIARRRPDLGLTDASLVALAHRQRTNRIATFDHAHFRTLKTRNGKPFVLLPADA